MNPADIDHPEVSTPETVARAVATTDETPSHFGERVNSLREMCKRYQPFGRFLAPFPATSVLQTAILAGNVPLVTVIPIFYPQTTLTQKAYQPGFIGSIGSMFRSFRGPLCFKVRVSNSTRDTPNFRGYIGFVPGPANLASVDVYQTMNISAPNRAQVDLSCPPLAYFSENQTAEFMVPFTSHYSIALFPGVSDNVVPLSQLSQFASYQLVVFIYGDGVALTTKYDITIMYAFADETHFGTFMGTPTIKFLPNIFPNLV